NSFGSGDERQRDGEDDVAWLDAGRGQRKPQRVRPAIHADAELRVAIVGKISFEAFHHRSANEAGRIHHGFENRGQLRLKLPVKRHEIHKRNLRTLGHHAILVSLVIERKTVAGFPATITFAGTSRVTTLPAPTMEFSPMVTFERIVAPEPIDAPRFTTVASTFQSVSV